MSAQAARPRSTQIWNDERSPIQRPSPAVGANTITTTRTRPRYPHMYHQHAPSRTVSGFIAPYTRQTVTPVSQRLCITSLHRGHVPSSSATSSTVDCQYCLLYSPLCGPPSETNLPSPMPPGPLLFGAQAIKTPEVEIPCCHWPVVAHYHWQGSPSHGRFTPTSLHVSLYDGFNRP